MRKRIDRLVCGGAIMFASEELLEGAARLRHTASEAIVRS